MHFVENFAGSVLNFDGSVLDSDYSADFAKREVGAQGKENFAVEKGEGLRPEPQKKSKRVLRSAAVSMAGLDPNASSITVAGERSTAMVSSHDKTC